MAKKLVGTIKLIIPAAGAKPSPPIGPALGQRGLNIMEFCKAFNAQTSNFEKDIRLSVRISAYADRSFEFVIKTPLTTDLILRKLGIKKGSSVPNKTKVGRLSRKDIEDIANIKFADLTASDLAAAVRTIAGSARSMGIEVEE